MFVSEYFYHFIFIIIYYQHYYCIINFISQKGTAKIIIINY